MKTKDEIISNYLETLKPTERECKICGDTFVGIRMVCSEACAWEMRARIEYNRSLRPLDYVSVPRKALIVSDFYGDEGKGKAVELLSAKEKK